MMIDAPHGLGCDHCEDEVPITVVRSRSGTVKLGLRCTLLWFPGMNAEGFEARHAPFRDHLGDAKRRAIRAQLA